MRHARNTGSLRAIASLVTLGLAGLALAGAARGESDRVANGGSLAGDPAGCLFTPEVIPLSGTQSAPGGRGSMTLTQPGSPFGVTVDDGGFQTFDIEIQVDQLRRRRGAVYVAWAAKPELDEWVQLGTLGEDSRLTARVAWNQFLVFVSEEASANVERWQGPIMLTGLSPSGRLHTMAGHGPFEAMNCQLYF